MPKKWRLTLEVPFLSQLLLAAGFHLDPLLSQRLALARPKAKHLVLCLAPPLPPAQVLVRLEQGLLVSGKLVPHVCDLPQKHTRGSSRKASSLL